MNILDLYGHFTWSFRSQFFIETTIGNFIWNDPDYGGNNTIIPYSGSYKDWCINLNIPYGRDKGQHIIKEYCGNELTILEN